MSAQTSSMNSSASFENALGHDFPARFSGLTLEETSDTNNDSDTTMVEIAEPVLAELFCLQAEVAHMHDSYEKRFQELELQHLKFKREIYDFLDLGDSVRETLWHVPEYPTDDENILKLKAIDNRIFLVNNIVAATPSLSGSEPSAKRVKLAQRRDDLFRKILLDRRMSAVVNSKVMKDAGASYLKKKRAAQREKENAIQQTV
ncbi:hypothetical protein C8J56DRAFT_976582 [Mycena floridula]|nr:hypothetical protein C8J56DRAFT_976582 [Mycena floridula]